MKKLKILIFDIETKPLLGYVWGLWENNLSLEQIKDDWSVLSWAAKWLGDPPEKIMYEDQRKSKDVGNDKKLLKNIWKLLDEADVVIAQNGKAFDHKKLNARFVLNGMQPPSSYKIIDTMLIAKKHFNFTSNKLAYLSDKLCTKYKKLKSKKFPGFEMWLECIAGNRKAWREMERYNKHDVLALEEVYYKLIPWDNTINFNVHHDEDVTKCSSCGHTKFNKRGYFYTNQGKFQRYKCKKCGAETRSKENLLSKEKRASLRVRTERT